MPSPLEASLTICSTFSTAGVHSESVQIASVSLEDVARNSNTNLDGIFNRVTSLDGGQEATDAGISTSVSVLNVFLGDCRDGNFVGSRFFAFTVANANKDGLRSLSDDGDTVTLGVGLLVEAHVSGSSGTVLGFESLLLSESAGLIFVAEGVIGVLNGVHHIVEVGEQEEGSSDVEGHRLVVLSAVASNLSHGFSIRSDEESGGVDELSRLEVAHVLVEVRSGVLARGSEVSAKSTLFSNDDTSAGSGRSIIINRHDGFHTELLAAVNDDIGVVILSNTSEVSDTSALNIVLSEEVGTSTGRVEASTTGRSHVVVVFISEDLSVDGHVAFFCEAGGSLCEVVFSEHGIVIVVS